MSATWQEIASDHCELALQMARKTAIHYDARYLCDEAESRAMIALCKASHRWLQGEQAHAFRSYLKVTIRNMVLQMIAGRPDTWAKGTDPDEGSVEVEGDESPPEENAEKSEMSALIRGLLSHPRDKGQRLIRLKYGFTKPGVEMDTKAIARKMGVSYKSALQIESRAMSRLTRELEDRIGQTVRIL